MVHLDITRLFQRLGRKTPSGIDRVLLEYADLALAQGWLFVAQVSGRLVMAPRWLAKDAVAHLAQSWRQGRHGAHAEVSRALDLWRGEVLARDGEYRKARFLSRSQSYFADLAEHGLRRRLSLAAQAERKARRRLPWLPPGLPRLALAFFPGWSARMVRLPLLRSRLARLDGEATVAEPGILERGTYLNVSHTGLEDRRIMEALERKASWRKVFYVHDLLPISHPHLHVRGERARHVRRMSNVARTARLVIANSRFTAGEFGRRFGLKAEILEIGTSLPVARPARTAPEGRRGLVAVGTVEPRKNHLWLIGAWLEFCRQNPSLPQEGDRLTVFGKMGWLPAREQRRFARLVDSSPRVEWRRDADDQEVAERMAASRACLSASEVEGWGMPLAESMALGIPVIASDVAAHHEVTRDLGRFYPFGDQAGLHAELARLFRPKEYRSLVRQTEKFRPFTWEDHFGRLLGMLEDL